MMIDKANGTGSKIYDATQFNWAMMQLYIYWLI